MTVAPAAPRAAGPGPVLVVAPSGGEAASAEMLAELRGLGVRVSSVTSDTLCDDAAEMAARRAAAGASAIVCLRLAPLAAELRLAASDAEPLAVVDTLDAPAAGAAVERAAALAVRMAEALRARWLAGSLPAAAAESAPAAVPEAAAVAPAPAPRPPPAPSRGAPAALPRPWVTVGAGAGALGSVSAGRVWAMPLLGLRGTFLPSRWGGVSIGIAGAPAPASRRGAMGGTVKTLTASGGLRLVFPVAGRLVVTGDVGLALVNRWERVGGATVHAGYGATFLGGGLAFRLTRLFALFAGAELVYVLARDVPSRVGLDGLLLDSGLALTF